MRFYAIDGTNHMRYAGAVLHNMRIGFSRLKHKLRGHKSETSDSDYDFIDADYTSNDDDILDDDILDDEDDDGVYEFTSKYDGSSIVVDADTVNVVDENNNVIDSAPIDERLKTPMDDAPFIETLSSEDKDDDGVF